VLLKVLPDRGREHLGSSTVFILANQPQSKEGLLIVEHLVTSIVQATNTVQRQVLHGVSACVAGHRVQLVAAHCCHVRWLMSIPGLALLWLDWFPRSGSSTACSCASAALLRSLSSGSCGPTRWLWLPDRGWQRQRVHLQVRGNFFSNFFNNFIGHPETSLRVPRKLRSPASRRHRGAVRGGHTATFYFQFVFAAITPLLFLAA